MKKFTMLLILSALITFAFSAIASAEYVNGYQKSNGTYVQGYNRSDRNDTETDNYSYYGNTNPYTGAHGHKR